MNPPINVLLIEDNSGDAQLIKEKLSSASSPACIHLEWVKCLQKGLDYLKTNPMDAILVELSLPDSNGLDTLQRVLNFVPQIPVIVMTRLINEETETKALQAGAQDFLVKDQVDGRLLVRVIQYGVQRKQIETQLADALEFNKRIVTSSPVGIFTYRRSGECLSVNAAAARMVGGTVEQLKNQNFHQIDSWKKSGLHTLAMQAIDTGRPILADVHITTSFGRDAWYTAQFVTFRSEGEELLLMMFSDITERKDVDAALQASEKRFRTWIENSSDVITVLDTTGTIQYESPSVKRVLGYQPEELLGKVAFNFIHPKDQNRIIATFVEKIQNPETIVSTDFRFRHRDGTWRFLEAVGHTYVDEHNEVVGLIHSRDITERKQAEEALKEKERLLSEAQRIGHIGSWSYDITSDSMKFSDEMYRLLDIQQEEFHHNREEFLALVYPSDRPTAARWFANIAEATQSKDLDFRIFHKNGELCYLHCTGVVEFDTATKPARFIGTAQDVTERRTAEMQINQQIKRLTALSDIDRAIISSFDQRYTLNVILSHIISLLQVDAVSILLLDSEQNLLTYTAGQGFRTKLMETTQVRVGEGHAGRSAKERRMVRIPDLRETTNLAEFNTLVMTEGFVSYIAMPLIAKGSVKGVLEVYHRSMLQPYQDWLEFFHTLVGQTAIAIENTTLFENLRETNKELVQAYDATIEGWSRAMDLRDRETEGHTQRVTKMTLALARSMGINESRLLHLRRGALLHDIGKLGVPDHILFKPGALTHEEREIIEKHVDFAYEMLAPIPYLKPALNIPYFHHEKWDGTGYPLGLKGEQIPLEARIFALIDVWDALLSDRPYRQAWTREKTIEYIRSEAGSHFDPRVVGCFLEMINGTDWQ